MRGLGDKLEDELGKLSGLASHASRVPAADPGVRSCPSCNLSMSRLVIGEVTVDSCSTHGTWFDRDEVAGVVAACTRLRRKQETPDASHDLVEGAGMFAGGAASLVVGGLAGLIEALLMPRDPRDRDNSSWD